ncbi:MAG TPA: GNAT family N-acetyltransferase [Planctomycetaceae bacterium]|nr:GNAT family N-acetyltransferase [Planctomycetaceae bacterium]
MLYRRFHNSDPPGLHRLWHISALGPNAAEGFSCDVFELFACSQPYWDPAGLIVAQDEESGKIAGFIHAGFAPDADQSNLNFEKGTICGLIVHPDFRRRKIGTNLVYKAEEYLRSRGARTVVAGAGLEQNAFYCGIYGGLDPSGFCNKAAAWAEFFQSCGYAAPSETLILRRDLLRSKDPVNAKLLRHRRHLNLVITDRPSRESWWWFVRYGHLDSLRFELHEKKTQNVVASGQIVGLDLFIPKWGVRSIGIREIFVPESQRRHGYAQALLLEICRRLKGESVELVEAHLLPDDQPSLDLFKSARFDITDHLLTFGRTLE